MKGVCPFYAEPVQEELDFIINYDIKYHMGKDNAENEDEG